MKSPRLFLTGKKRRFSGNCLRSPARAELIINKNQIPLWGLFGVWFITVLACSSLSPLTTVPETPIVNAYVPEDLIPQWVSFAQDICPGIAYFEGSIRKPRLRLWALRIDLTEPTLRIVVSERAPVDGVIREGIIPSTTVSSFVRRYDCLAGINTNPFRPASTKEGEERSIVGITVSAGTMVALPCPQYDALVFYPGGKAVILSQAALSATIESERNGSSRIMHAVGGFYAVLRDGMLTEAALAERGQVRYPRSAAGLSGDGVTLYLLVIDGRRAGSIGATESEIGVILKQLGATDGINFDGGGSTSLALQYPDGTVRPVNIPIHGGIPGRERGVATCLGIAPDFP